VIIVASLAIFSLQILSSTVLLSKILQLQKNSNPISMRSGPIHIGFLSIPGASILFLEYLLLSIFKIFCWQTVVLVVLINFIVGFQIISDYFRKLKLSLTKHRYFIINFLILLPVAILQSLLTLKPDENTDVAVFHQPLIDSLVQNNGLMWTQIEHPFYGSIPLAFHLLVAGLFIFTESTLSSHIVNFAFFWMLLILILSFTKKTYFNAILIVVFILVNSYFIQTPTDGMQDSFRSILIVASLYFLFFALDQVNANYLILSGLVAGLAISTKMSELLIIPYLALLMLVKYKWSRKNFTLRVFFINLLIPMFVVGSFFYVRNLWYTGNPIYPFLFKHPGLSTEWMDSHRIELLKRYNPLDRNLNNNPISPSSLLDFFQAFDRYFLGTVFQNLTILILVIAFFISKRFRPLLLVNLTMYFSWYYFMLNHVRWALPAYFLSVTLAVIILSEFIFYCRESRFTKALNKKKSFLVTLALPLIFLLAFSLKGQILEFVSKFENQFRSFSVYVNSAYQNNLESYFNEKISNYELMKYVDSVGYERVYTSGLGSLNQFNRLYSGNQKQIYKELTKDSLPTTNFIFFKQLDGFSEPDLSKVLNKDSTQQIIFQTKRGTSLWCIKVEQDTRFCR
jgi:hypothetical protein